jgi:hypothetical protein
MAGTMPLRNALQYPCETILSGPAASTMGAKAITGQNTNAVVLDIGGTTTDISLLLDGHPYMLHEAPASMENIPILRPYPPAPCRWEADSPVCFEPQKRGIYSSDQKGTGCLFWRRMSYRYRYLQL